MIDMTNQKVILKVEIEENGFGGLDWKNKILYQSQEMLTEDFKESICDDLESEIKYLLKNKD